MKNNKFILNKNECNYVDVARVIGIYLIVLSHLPYDESKILEKGVLLTFNLPFFFFISGFLHKQESISWDSIKKIFVGLFIPYVLYNLLLIIPIIILDGNVPSVSDVATSMFYVDLKLPNISTWFFAPLFFIKIVSLFLRKKQMYAILAVLCIVYLVLAIGPVGVHHLENPFKYKSTIMAFPYFAIGYLGKDLFNIKLKKYVQIAIVVVGWIGIFVILHFYPPVYLTVNGFILANTDMVFPWYSNLAISYLGAFLGILSTMCFSQLIIEYVKHDALKVLSRGIMFIVGTHFFFLAVNFVLVKHDVPFLIYMLLVAIMMVIYYFLIKLTYNRFPILYGRLKR